MTDLERIRKASIAYNRNVRQALRDSGMVNPMVELDRSALLIPPAGHDTMEGVDATPKELIAYNIMMANRANTRSAMISRAALTGLAGEMSMHDVNSNMSSLGYALKGIEERTDDPHILGHVKRGKAAVSELSNGFEFLYRVGHTGYRTAYSGEELDKLLRDEYGHAISRGQLVLETTPAFLKTKAYEINGKVALAVLSNLIRNGYYWGRRGPDDKEQKPHVRLDVRQVEVQLEVEPGEKPETHTHTIFSVEDNGPGVPKDKRETVFLPYNTGRVMGKGIGLYICKGMLENSHSTIRVDDEPSDLGGARFVFGSNKALSPEVTPPLDERVMLATAGENIAALAADEQWSELGECIDVYADIQREALRIRIIGPADDFDRRLIEAADAAAAALAAAPGMGNRGPSGHGM